MKKLNRFVLTRVLLSITIAVLVVLTKKEMIWGGFKVLLFPRPVFRFWVAFMILLLLSAIWRVLLEMYRRGMFPSVKHFIERSLAPAYHKFLSTIHHSTSRISFQFLLWGSVTSLITAVFWNTGLLRDSRLNEIRQMPIPGNKIAYQENTPTTVLTLGSLDNNQDLYLKNCLKIVKDLKAVGAKAVLIPLDYAWSGTATGLVRELNETGIVVFGNQSGSDFQFGDPKTGEIYKYRGGYFTSWGGEYPWYSFIRRIEPIAMRMPFSLRRDPAYDVSFEMLRLYYGISEGESPEVRGNEVMFGSHRYPVDDDGGIYVGKLAQYDHFPRISAFYDPKTETLKYRYNESAGGGEDLASFEPVRESFEGKMVVLNWWWGNLGNSWWRSDAYAHILDHLVQGDTLIQSRWGTLLMALFAVISCGFILKKSSPLTAVALLMVVFWAVALLSAWLFQVEGVIVDAVYSLMGIAISVVVFSVVRLAHEWQFGTNGGHALQDLIAGKGAARPSTPQMGLTFLRKRVSFSPAAAVVVLILVIMTTALVTSGVKERKSINSPQEVVYVTSLPTVEVQGVYIPDKEAKQ